MIGLFAEQQKEINITKVIDLREGRQTETTVRGDEWETINRHMSNNRKRKVLVLSADSESSRSSQPETKGHLSSPSKAPRVVGRQVGARNEQ